MGLVYAMTDSVGEPRKIALLISTLGGGGSERVCVILANGLSQLGWQVDVVILKPAENDRSSNLCDNVSLVCLNVARARYAPKMLLRYLNDSQPSIVLSFNNEVAIAEFLVTVLRKRKYQLVHRNVTTLSSVLYHSGGGFLNKCRYWLLKKVLRRVDLVVCQCEAMAKDAGRELGAGRMPYIYNPAGSKLPERSARHLSSREKFILCVGRIDQNKCIQLAAEALALLPSPHGKTELWIAGDGIEKARVTLLVEQLGLQHRVRFLGYRQDLEDLYMQAALVSLTSHFEGFPNVLIEAISHGCPVVSVDCPSGPREIIEDGVNGFLVKERTPEAIANAYAKALAKNWDRKVVSRTAEKFSQERILKQWHELLSEHLITRTKI